MESNSPRRLAAVLAADIAGYSRLMETDESGTHRRVLGLVRDFVAPTIAEHRGRLIKTTGDGFLAMFESPVEAVRCAIVIQQNMAGRNLETPRSQWIQYRIGVNLGDVIVETDDIYGEGVNIAARLEQLAEPGNVYISGGIYEQIKHKLVCAYQSLGDRKVKNITDPVPIYRVLPDPAAVERARKRQQWRVRAVAAIGAVIVVSGAAGGWYARRLQTNQASARPEATPPQPELTAAAGDTGKAHVTVAPAVAPAEQQVALIPPRPPAAPKPSPPAFTEPDMVLVPGGRFRMGSTEDPSEKPIHIVAIRPFWIGKYPVTIKEWRACVAARACSYAAQGADDSPVSNVSWADAQQFTGWLARVTGKPYRLPTEAEWEYAARAGAATKYWWGNTIGAGRADCKGCGGPYDPGRPLKVGSFAANRFGLHDMGGNVAEWVADCWHPNYVGAPSNGSAWEGSDCPDHVLRGGSWLSEPEYVRVSDREYYETGVRYPGNGFRVARSD